MLQTKYALALPINLGLGFDFWPCSESDFSQWVSVVRELTSQVTWKHRENGLEF